MRPKRRELRSRSAPISFSFSARRWEAWRTDKRMGALRAEDEACGAPIHIEGSLHRGAPYAGRLRERPLSELVRRASPPHRLTLRRWMSDGVNYFVRSATTILAGAVGAGLVHRADRLACRESGARPGRTADRRL